MKKTTLLFAFCISLWNINAQTTNDLCEDAIAVSCDETIVGSTLEATDVSGDGTPDVFYTFTGMGEPQQIYLSLCDGATDYDSRLTVFEDGCDFINFVEDNDDFCGFQSQLTFVSDGVTTYTIVVQGSIESDIGNFSLAITCTEPLPPIENNNCENAIALECDTTVINTTDDEAVTDTGGSEAPDVYYTYTGSGVEESITLSLCDGGTNYDSFLRVFDDECNLSNEIAFNDDTCGLQSEVTFISDGTTTYTIMVEGFGQFDFGNYSLAVTCATLGVDENIFEGFTFFPNPVQEILNLDARTAIDNVKVFNLLGKKVLEHKEIGFTNYQLNTSSLAKGAYIMQVTIEGQTGNYQIIKN